MWTQKGGDMTKKQAKKLCLEVWRYLRDHPEIRYKDDLPIVMYGKINECIDDCPLCSVVRGRTFNHCPECPLESCRRKYSFFAKWERAKTPKTRAKYAGLIVKAVEEWKV